MAEATVTPFSQEPIAPRAATAQYTRAFARCPARSSCATGSRPWG